MTDEPSVPTGRLRRLAKLASVGARTGASLLLSRDGKGAAEHAATVLGSLRGLAAKIGQTASYVDGLVPDDHRDAYERALGKLQAATLRSSPAAIRKIVEDELAMSIDEAYAEWSDEPFASASIGQVHRARLHDGREVAVKVQHPGIADAVESDLRNASTFESFVGVLVPKSLNVPQLFEVVAQRFREELDYELEATRQRWFAEFHAGDPFIRVPTVIPERSRRRVLTSEFVQGVKLDDVVDAPLERRRHYAEVMWRFVFRSNLVGGMFNADPHPGNYLFDGERVVFLDFGCVQPLELASRIAARTMHGAAIRGDEPTFERGCAALLGTRGGAYEAAAIAYVRRCFDPLFTAPFLIDRDYVAAVVRQTQTLKNFAFKRDPTFVSVPPNLVFINRLQFGFYSVLARLAVPVDYAAIERKILDEVAALPEMAAATASTPG